MGAGREPPRVLCAGLDLPSAERLARDLSSRHGAVLASDLGGALRILEEEPLIAVLILDGAPPPDDSAGFLSRAQDVSPDTVRVLLVDEPDLPRAARAMHTGAVFRFALKPCPPEVFEEIVEESIEHHLLATADRRYLEKLVFRDDLTKLYNRRYLDLVLPREHARCIRRSRPYSLLFIDLDGVRAVNTNHGHLVGSALIASVGDLLAELTRGADLVFRFGGDEFVVLLVETEQDVARVVADRICSGISSYGFVVDGAELSVTASVGVASFPEDGDTWSEVLSHADRAMYRAKSSGRSRVVSSSRSGPGEG